MVRSKGVRLRRLRVGSAAGAWRCAASSGSDCSGGVHAVGGTFHAYRTGRRVDACAIGANGEVAVLPASARRGRADRQVAIVAGSDSAGCVYVRFCVGASFERAAAAEEYCSAPVGLAVDRTGADRMPARAVPDGRRDAVRYVAVEPNSRWGLRFLRRRRATQMTRKMMQQATPATIPMIIVRLLPLLPPPPLPPPPPPPSPICAAPVPVYTCGAVVVVVTTGGIVGFGEGGGLVGGAVGGSTVGCGVVGCGVVGCGDGCGVAVGPGDGFGVGIGVGLGVTGGVQN
eukprot:CAMPEP_0170745014 /NCGR_PEP_ID=MMETSP0437-20130122/8078_1 /TAXON_ID=0 /ORGANISM="Sexangularia sp." /LENGTH=285 /DNA_ID=CAMNT_0011083727 /DNA_START=56 /DNA_END=914 /DNA_ORIENTATION=+